MPLSDHEPSSPRKARSDSKENGAATMYWLDKNWLRKERLKRNCRREYWREYRNRPGAKEYVKGNNKILYQRDKLWAQRSALAAGDPQRCWRIYSKKQISKSRCYLKAVVLMGLAKEPAPQKPMSPEEIDEKKPGQKPLTPIESSSGSGTRRILRTGKSNIPPGKL